VLVNASRQFLPTDALDGDDTSVETLWQENVMTAMQLTQQVAKRMIKQAERARGRRCWQHHQPELDDLAAHTARADGLIPWRQQRWNR